MFRCYIMLDICKCKGSFLFLLESFDDVYKKVSPEIILGRKFIKSRYFLHVYLIWFLMIKNRLREQKV